MPVSVHALAQRSAAGTRPAGASAPKKAARTAIARAVVAPESARPKEGPIIINGQVWTMGRGRGREREGGGRGPRREHARPHCCEPAPAPPCSLLVGPAHPPWEPLTDPGRAMRALATQADPCPARPAGLKGAARLSLRSLSRLLPPPLTPAAPPSLPLPLPLPLPTQIPHPITAERLECVRSITDHVEKNVYPILRSTESLWQPTDFLPDSSSPDFLDEVRDLRARTASLPDDYLVVLVGDMITEEALPTYMAMLNTLDGVRDETGAADTPWAKWTREWTAEENRHGDLMNKYCYLSGRVNMKAIEWTIQNLIGSGMDPRTENNPYFGFVYTSFQERATKVSHGNTALHAAEHGDKVLSKICAAIAGDEARHERAYQKIMDKLFELDPSGSMCAFSDMMQRQIVMPAHLMDDRSHGKSNVGSGAARAANLFKDFSSVAQATGTYTGGFLFFAF